MSLKVEEIITAQARWEKYINGRRADSSFLGGDEDLLTTDQDEPSTMAAAANDNWEEEADDLMGQLAVDVFETEEELIIKARTAGVDRNDLDVLAFLTEFPTISGSILSSGEDTRRYGIGISKNVTGVNLAELWHCQLQSKKKALKPN